MDGTSGSGLRAHARAASRLTTSYRHALSPVLVNHPWIGSPHVAPPLSRFRDAPRATTAALRRLLNRGRRVRHPSRLDPILAPALAAPLLNDRGWWQAATPSAVANIVFPVPLSREHIHQIGVQVARVLGHDQPGWMAERLAELDRGDVSALLAAARALPEPGKLGVAEPGANLRHR